MIRTTPFNPTFIVTVMTVLLSVCLLVSPGQAQSGTGEDPQDLIRSAMVFNFCKFIQWPQQEAAGDSLILGILGDPANAPDFSSLAGKSVGEIPIAVRQIRNQEALPNATMGPQQYGQAYVNLLPTLNKGVRGGARMYDAADTEEEQQLAPVPYAIMPVE